MIKAAAARRVRAEAEHGIERLAIGAADQVGDVPDQFRRMALEVRRVGRAQIALHQPVGQPFLRGGEQARLGGIIQGLQDVLGKKRRKNQKHQRHGAQKHRPQPRLKTGQKRSLAAAAVSATSATNGNTNPTPTTSNRAIAMPSRMSGPIYQRARPALIFSRVRRTSKATSR